MNLVFHSRYTNLYSDCFPKKEVRSRYNNRKSRLTEGLKFIKHKNKSFVKQIKNKNNYNEFVYKKYRRNLQIFYDKLKNNIMMIYLQRIKI